MNTPTIPERRNLEGREREYKASRQVSQSGTTVLGIERLLTSQEVGDILGIHPKVVERMARRGEIPALKVGKFWRYRLLALDGWIDSQSQSGRQPCRMETSF